MKKFHAFILFLFVAALLADAQNSQEELSAWLQEIFLKEPRVTYIVAAGEYEIAFDHSREVKQSNGWIEIVETDNKYGSTETITFHLRDMDPGSIRTIKRDDIDRRKVLYQVKISTKGNETEIKELEKYGIKYNNWFALYFSNEELASEYAYVMNQLIRTAPEKEPIILAKSKEIRTGKGPRGLDWGMSKEEVMALEKANFLGDDVLLEYSDMYQDNQIRITYFFEYDKLDLIGYTFEKTFEHYNMYIDFYCQMLQKHTELFGEPINNDKIWVNKSYENTPESRYGFAVSQGYLKLRAEWDWNDTRIVLHLSESNKVPSVGIGFFPLSITRK